MCDADTAVITYNWLKGHYKPHPNFNVEHQCRDFDAVLRYATEHRIDVEGKYNGVLPKPTDGSIVEFEGEPPFDPEATS